MSHDQNRVHESERVIVRDIRDSSGNEIASIVGRREHVEKYSNYDLEQKIRSDNRRLEEQSRRR